MPEGGYAWLRTCGMTFELFRHHRNRPPGPSQHLGRRQRLLPLGGSASEPRAGTLLMFSLWTLPLLAARTLIRCCLFDHDALRHHAHHPHCCRCCPDVCAQGNSSELLTLPMYGCFDVTIESTVASAA